MVILFSGYNHFMTKFTTRNLLFTSALLLISNSVYSETLDQFCHEYRQEPGEIIVADENRSEGQSDEFSSGLLWKIETQTGRSNYLFGTMHSQDRAVSQFPPKVRLALAQSQPFIIESVLTEKSNKVFFDSIFSPSNEKLSDLIAEPIYQYLEEVLSYLIALPLL